ncbi:MAG: hypothetical protein WC389_19005, partial [Lutibacter sp.]
MNYSGNIAADLLYEADQSQTNLPEKTVYYCESCEKYYDKDGNEELLTDDYDYNIVKRYCEDCAFETKQERPEYYKELVQEGIIRERGLFEVLGECLRK